MKKGRVLRRKPLKKGYFLLEVAAPELAQAPEPGQFVMLRAWPGDDPLLARPFSVHDVKGDRLLFLIRICGRGTKLLAELSAGDEIFYLGPLGRGFPIQVSEPIYLVAGGIGIAPFYFTAKELLFRKKEIVLVYGARSKGHLLRISAFEKLGLKAYLVTEDGSAGAKGLVTDLLENLSPSKGTIFACGPLPMLSAVAQWGKSAGLKVYLSLEARMACGLGLCLGCALKRRAGGYLHVCTEGPVVPAETVF